MTSMASRSSTGTPFEQLCLNVANEELQQHCNAHTFLLDRRFYTKAQFLASSLQGRQPQAARLKGMTQGTVDQLIDDDIGFVRSVVPSMVPQDANDMQELMKLKPELRGCRHTSRT